MVRGGPFRYFGYLDNYDCAQLTRIFSIRPVVTSQTCGCLARQQGYVSIYFRIYLCIPPSSPRHPEVVPYVGLLKRCHVDLHFNGHLRCTSQHDAAPFAAYRVSAAGKPNMANICREIFNVWDESGQHNGSFSQAIISPVVRRWMHLRTPWPDRSDESWPLHIGQCPVFYALPSQIIILHSKWSLNMIGGNIAKRLTQTDNWNILQDHHRGGGGGTLPRCATTQRDWYNVLW